LGIIAGLFFILRAVSFGMEPDLWSLPPLPKSETIWKDKHLELNGLRARWTHLRSSLSQEEIINFYKENLSQKGWEFGGVHGDFHVFKKPGKFMYIRIIKKDIDSNYYEVYLIVSPYNLAVCNELKDYFFKEKIAPDTPGRDPIDIPRYPNSKRRMSIIAPFEGSVFIYETQDSSLEIAKFYRKVLKNKGWSEPSVFNSKIAKDFFSRMKNRVFALCFQKEEDTVIINIFTPPKEFFEKCGNKCIGRRSLIVIVQNIEKYIERDFLQEE